jgi:hypothetical protein
VSLSRRNRDIFRKTLVHSRAIVDGAVLMWQKKQHVVASQYISDDSMANYYALSETDLYFVDLYDVCHDIFNECTYNEHINKLLFVQDARIGNDFDDYSQAEMEYDEQVFEEYMASGTYGSP